MVEDARLDAVNLREFAVEDYPLGAHDEDRAADLLGRDRAGVLCLSQIERSTEVSSISSLSLRNFLRRPGFFKMRRS